MILDELEILFEEDDMDFDGPTSDQLYKMYGIFLNDFHKNPLLHNGKKVIINVNRSRHPLFRGKFETFVHVVTRDNKYNDKRQYDRDRANRIHWIRPVLEHHKNPRISCFERTDEKGNNQYYYWLQERSFMIILREISAELLLLTAFCVDDFNKAQYRRYLNEYRNRRQ